MTKARTLNTARGAAPSPGPGPFVTGALPEDPATLREMVAGLLQTLHESHTRITVLEAAVARLSRQCYGPRAERIAKGQLGLFADAGAPAGTDQSPPGAPPPPAAASTSAPAAKRARPTGRQPLPANLPRQIIVIELPTAQRACPCCGKERCAVSEEVSEQAEYIPGRVVVLRTVRKTYACGGCHTNGNDPQMVTAPPPPAPIEKGLAGPGLLSQVIMSKYGDHLPLHRLERIMARAGLAISRSTMCEWCMRMADVLAPLAALMKSRVLGSQVIQTDDTPVKVLNREEPGTHQGHFWSYLGDEVNPYVVFDYSPSRAGVWTRQWLEGYQGFLQSDAFTGYDALHATGRVVEVGCWAHARRKFYDARGHHPQPALHMLALIARLYAVEDEVREQVELLRSTLPPPDGGGEWETEHRLIRRLRGEQARPVLGEIANLLETPEFRIDDGSDLATAAGYARSHWSALTRYIEHGFLSIDNNACERSLRRVAIGRKNWLFCGSDRGGHAAAVFFTLIASADRQNMDPYYWLHEVIGKIASWPKSRLEELLPDRWAQDKVERYEAGHGPLADQNLPESLDAFDAAKV